MILRVFVIVNKNDGRIRKEVDYLEVNLQLETTSIQLPHYFKDWVVQSFMQKLIIYGDITICVSLRIALRLQLLSLHEGVPISCMPF